MIERIYTGDMSREQWLEARRGSIGGSEIGAVLRLHKYASPYSVWARKCGLVPELEDSEAMRQGRDLEEYVAQRFCEASGLRVRRWPYLVRNSEYPHLHANIDRRIDGEAAGLECKTASALRERAFTTGSFPAEYYAQCVQYLAVTELRRWYLAVLVLGREFKVYLLTRDQDDEKPAFCESMVYVPQTELDGIREAGVRFWGFVERREAPPVDGMAATAQALEERFAGGDPEQVDLAPYGAELDKLAALKDERDKLSEQITRRENEIRAYLGDAEEGACADWRVSWRRQARRTLDARRLERERPELWAEISPYYRKSESRVLRITGKDE